MRMPKMTRGMELPPVFQCSERYRLMRSRVVECDAYNGHYVAMIAVVDASGVFRHGYKANMNHHDNIDYPILFITDDSSLAIELINQLDAEAS